MSPAEVAATVRLRLAAQLDDDLAVLDALADAVARLVAPTGDERGEWMRTLALAFAVERYYTAVESLLARIMRTTDGDVPSGAAWHLELLHASSVAIEHGRPALVDRGAADELRELLKFRHLARHGYEREPRLDRMVDHAARVERIQPALRATLGGLGSWLRSA